MSPMLEEERVSSAFTPGYSLEGLHSTSVRVPPDPLHAYANRSMDVAARGPNFVYSREFIQKAHGPEAWLRILDALPPEAATVWRTAILDRCYPFSAYKAILPAIAQETGASTDQELARMYAYSADRSLTTVFKVFLRMANPSFVIGKYPQLWNLFFAGGEVRVPEARKGEARVEFTVPEIFLDWLPAACLGYSYKAVELAGGRDLTQEEEGRERLPNGTWRITYRLHWKE